MAKFPIHELAHLAGSYDDTTAFLRFLYHGTEFAIEIHFSEKTKPSLDEYTNAVEFIHNPGLGVVQAHQHLMQLLLQPLAAVINEHVDGMWDLDSPIGLDRFLATPHRYITLHETHAMTVQEGSVSPTYHLHPLPLSDLDPEDIAHLPRMAASNVTFPNLNPLLPSLQREARIPEDRKVFFKPLEYGREREVLREIRMQNRLLNFQKHRTSQILALAMSDDEHICGLLLQWTDALPLAHVSDDRKGMHGSRWREQVTDFVSSLHEADLVWGDINAHNILIDDRDEVWMVDFGGKPEVDYSTANIEDLKQEDWEELKKVFEEHIVDATSPAFCPCPPSIISVNSQYPSYATALRIMVDSQVHLGWQYSVSQTLVSPTTSQHS